MENWWQDEHTVVCFCLTDYYNFTIWWRFCTFSFKTHRNHEKILQLRKATVSIRGLWAECSVCTWTAGWVASAGSSVLRDSEAVCVRASRGRMHWWINFCQGWKRREEEGCRGVTAVIAVLGSRAFGKVSEIEPPTGSIGALSNVHLDVLGNKSPTDSPFKNLFQMKWWEKGTFFIRTQNEDVPKEKDVGSGAGLWLDWLDASHFVPPTAGMSLCSPWPMCLEDMTHGPSLKCGFIFRHSTCEWLQWI